LFWALCDPGDAVLTTGPTALSDVPALLFVAPTTAANNYEPTVDDLERVYQQAVAAGHAAPKLLVISQPNNPTAAVYSPAALRRILDWACSKPGLHVVSDERYANSAAAAIHVTSAAHILFERNANENDNDSNHYYYLGDRVHIVAGGLLDWGGGSWFRVGTLLTHNAALHQALLSNRYYYHSAGVAPYTAWALTRLLDDDTEWRDGTWRNSNEDCRRRGMLWWTRCKGLG